MMSKGTPLPPLPDHLAMMPERGGPEVYAEQVIEPDASRRGVSDPRNPPNEMFQASIAISLKRIADALWGIEGTAGVLQLLNPLDVRNNY
jgi:hypothetical protein